MNKAHLTNNKGWCSTKVDASGKHIGAQGNWGNCDCKVKSEMATTTISTTTSPSMSKFSILHMFHSYVLYVSTH